MLPEAMQAYPHWVLWRAEERNGKLTKVPYQARVFERASVTDPMHWSTFDEVVSRYHATNGLFSGIGFVLSSFSPYTIIDLDDPSDDPAAIERAQKVLSIFESYTEVSQSGRGMHIVLSGKVPCGIRRGKIEVYSEERFFAMTGNTYKDLPITSNDYYLRALWEELGGTVNHQQVLVNDAPQQIVDEDVFNRATKGHTMFQDLWFGRWTLHYSSQSEADLALVNIISFYSGNKEQIARMFLLSELGKRPKARRQGRNGKLGYLEEMIEKSFDNRLPDSTLEALMGNLNHQIENIRRAKEEKPVSMLGDEWTMPPGLVGEIAEYIYAQAPRPVKEIALAGAIALMAGICGQAYNVSATGLNQYILLLATTGRGKEAAKSGIGKIMKQVCEQLPSAAQFIGPADIASGQALVKYIGTNPCFVSVIGEFGLTMQQMCAPNASAAQVSLRRIILDLFNKSGKNDTLHSTIYSDKANNTAVVRSPALTILGETTPDSFFPNMHEGVVSWGLLPRFTCIEYSGKRVPQNKHHAEAVLSPELISKVITLAQNALTLQHRNEAIPVDADSVAIRVLDTFDDKCDERINNADSEVARQLWTRGHMKLLKLAALIAVGVHPFQPVISEDIARWAQNMVEKDIANILSRFEEGSVGTNNAEQNQFRELSQAIREYCTRPFDTTMEKYLVDQRMHADKTIQWSYISRRLSSRPAFKNDKMGAKFALGRCMSQAVDVGAAIELTAQQSGQRYNKSGKAYVILDLSRLS